MNFNKHSLDNKHYVKNYYPFYIDINRGNYKYFIYKNNIKFYVVGLVLNVFRNISKL